MTSYIYTTPATTNPGEALTVAKSEYDEIVAKLAAAELRLEQMVQHRDSQSLELREVYNEWSNFDGELREAADNAGLCSQFDDFVETWNRNARRLQLTPRHTTVDVTVTVRFSMTCDPDDIDASAHTVMREILDMSSGTTDGIEYCDADYEINDYC